MEMTRDEWLNIIKEAKRSRKETLDLSGKNIRALPRELGELTNLRKLILQNAGIESLGDSIGDLKNLVTLDLSGNKLSNLSNSISRLKNLKTLILSRNPLETVPNSFGQLRSLNFLSLNDTALQYLPDSFGDLSELVRLEIVNTPIQSLPFSIGYLANLIHLDIRDNQLRDLPSSLSQSSKLKRLDVRFNKLKELPDDIGNLTRLRCLLAGSNSLSNLPESIGDLINLEELDISSNYLRLLPDSIGECRKLIKLDIQNNKLFELPNHIGNLRELEDFNFARNNISSIPESIVQASSLKTLDGRNNQLRELPSKIGQLKSLNRLVLYNNRLQNLPKSISEIPGLTECYLSENPWGNLPPEITSKGTHGILRHYQEEAFIRQLEEEGIEKLYEAKLIIVGEGGAGKTSLANKLINPDYKLKLRGSANPEETTEGIDILRLDFPHPSGSCFRINIWDFGGQEIYKATHQFFLTKRSLYLIVADTRQDNTDFNYWLEAVQLLSEDSPTLIIKNEEQERLCQVNGNQLRKRFSNLKDIFATNLATNRGLPEILTAIQHYISQLPHIGDPLPKTWVRVRAALEADTRNYITQTEFLTLCDTHGFKRHEDKFQLSGYLHDLGVCLHFQDDDLLQRYVILKPEWGTTAVYKVFDTEKVQKSFGYFTQSDLKIIWADEQHTTMRPELLQLMKNFKLCYEIPHKPKTYIAPQLLSVNQPKYQWDDTENLILRYHYEFMPKGMITRFIVEMHRLIDSELVWKDGVILKSDDTCAEVIEARYRNEIRIRLSGKIKKPLLETIRYEFKKIHDSYGDRLSYQEYIPCNCAVCNGSQKPHDYAVHKLYEYITNGKEETDCDKPPYHKVNVRSLMDDTIGLSSNRPSYDMDTNYRKGYEDVLDLAQRLANRPINNTATAEANAMADQSQRPQTFNGPVGVVANDHAQVTNFTQINNANTAELLQLIATMRQTAAQFPQEIQDDILIDIDDVEAEIKKSEANRNIPKIRKRLIAILAAVGVIFGSIASATDFANNAIDVGSKLGIELHLPPATQNKAPDGKP
jgi:internalin A